MKALEFKKTAISVALSLEFSETPSASPLSVGRYVIKLPQCGSPFAEVLGAN